MKKRWVVPLLLALLLLVSGCRAAGEGTPATAAADVDGTSPAAAVPAEPERTLPVSMPGAVPAASPSPSFSSKPEPKPEPEPEPELEPEPEPAEEARLSCTLWIRCDTILDNLDQLAPEKAALVPENGVLLCVEGTPFEQGESVFDLLLRVTRAQKVHLEFVNAPFYGSAYIEGIGNLYEFDCGDLSGWSYKVNGVFPGYGCSLYELSDGDVVEWVYTCDLGRDVGGSNRWEGAG